MEIKLHLRTIVITTALILTTTAISDDKESKPVEINGKPSKRGTSELSYSYAATDIGSKGGTHVKTITIIKNYAHKDKNIKINPELHKDEDWGSKFRDNYDSFGKIPEIPEIEEPLKKATEESEDQSENREDIPIQEAVVENEEVQENQEEGNAAEQNQEGENNNEENEEKKDNYEEKKTAASDDVEIFDKSALKVQNGQKSQSLISIFPRSSGKPQKYIEQSSSAILHIRPPHQIAIESNLKPIFIGSKSTSSPAPAVQYTPYKLPKIYKPVTYSPLLFPSYAIQPLINGNNKNPSSLSFTSSTTPILPQINRNENGNGNSQLVSTTSAKPYIAPNIKKPIGSISSTIAPSSFANNEVSTNLINLKLSNKRVTPPSPRSRGLRYKRESIK